MNSILTLKCRPISTAIPSPKHRRRPKNKRSGERVIVMMINKLKGSSIPVYVQRFALDLEAIHTTTSTFKIVISNDNVENMY